METGSEGDQPCEHMSSLKVCPSFLFSLLTDSLISLDSSQVLLGALAPVDRSRPEGRGLRTSASLI